MKKSDMMLPNSKSHTEYGIAWNDAVNRCWEEFESHTCSNCEYYKEDTDSVMYCEKDVSEYSNMEFEVSITFGCNKFKRRK